jgi:D-alanine--poly(phosphoribitol) ligase subunit 1
MKLINKIFYHSKKNPHKVIINNNNSKITYSEFWQKCINLAFYLKKNNLNRVCILENEKNDYVCYVAMVASLISGSTYIPINFSTPLERLKNIISQSQANILILKNKFKHKIKIKKMSQKNIKELKRIRTFNFIKSKKDAYIIFTSGSTGNPKGVRISRNSLDHYISWITKNFFNDKIIRSSQHPGIGFDLSVADIYGTICSGGTLYPIKTSYDKLFLNKFIKKNALTHWVSVPSAIDIICNSQYFKKNDLKSLNKMFFCGEILKKIHLQKIFNSNAKIEVINSYGPTETTVSCTSIKLNNSNFKKYCKPTVSFGKTIKNMKIGLLGKNKNFQGELYIRGPQLSEGYLKNEFLNKKKFVNLKNKRTFITGDICKIINGNYYFLSRIDRQIKILGNRIELDEIDMLIGDSLEKTSYSVIYKDKIFTFFEDKFDKDNVKKMLEKKLPKYMLPKKLIKINKWPRNKNLKIDDKKLIKLYINGKKFN